MPRKSRKTWTQTTLEDFLGEPPLVPPLPEPPAQADEGLAPGRDAPLPQVGDSERFPTVPCPRCGATSWPPTDSGEWMCPRCSHLWPVSAPQPPTTGETRPCPRCGAPAQTAGTWARWECPRCHHWWRDPPAGGPSWDVSCRFAVTLDTGASVTVAHDPPRPGVLVLESPLLSESGTLVHAPRPGAEPRDGETLAAYAERIARQLHRAYCEERAGAEKVRKAKGKKRRGQ